MIKAEELCFSYDKQILKNISFEISSGEFVGIIGPNGSGKTTLLRILSGYLQPESGKVSINDQDILTIKVQDLAKLRSLVPQESHLDFDYSVEDIVWMGRNPYAGMWGAESGEDLVKKALQDCELKDLQQRNARTLSGGEWQRVVLARALAQDTSIVFLDEPTHFLDLYYQINTLKILEQLNKQGKTIVAVFHDLNLAAKFCKKFIILKAGEKYAEGDFKKVINAENIKKVYKVDVNIVDSTKTVVY